MSANKTQNIGLHSWDATDQVKRTEFNENFNKIDADSKTKADQIGNLSGYTKTLVINAKYPPIPMVACKGDGGTNDAPAIQSMVNFIQNNGGGTLYFPASWYQINTKVTVTDAVSFEGDFNARSVLRFNVTDDFGLSFYGSGLGGSGIDGFRFEKLNIQGTATKALVNIFGVGLFRIESVIAQNFGCGVFYVDTCQDFLMQHVDILGSGTPFSTNIKQTSAVYFVNSNHCYLNYFRIEYPLTYAIYAEKSDVQVHKAKIDGNLSSSTAAYVVSDNAGITFDDFEFSGAKSYIAELKGYGSINFNDCLFGGCTSPAIVKALTVNYAEGAQPGVILAPSVSFDNCFIDAQPHNVPYGQQQITAFLYAVSPEIIYNPESSTEYQIDSFFYNGSENVYQFGLAHFNGTSYVTQTANDIYNYHFIVNKTTGSKLKVQNSFNGGLTKAEYLPYLSSDFGNGTGYRMEYARINGVILSVKRTNVHCIQDSFAASNFNAIAIYDSAVTLSGATWSAANYQTTVTLSKTYTAGALVGFYLYNPTTDKSYLIRSNTATTVTVDYNVASELTGSFIVRAGKPTGILDYKIRSNQEPYRDNMRFMNAKEGADFPMVLLKRSALPNATPDRQGQTAFIPGAVGAPDSIYMCVKQGNDSYVWSKIPINNSGTLTYNGDGTSTSKTIPHNLGATPNYFNVQSASVDAGNANIKYVTADATNLTVYFGTAPIIGTNNVSLKWRAEM